MNSSKEKPYEIQENAREYNQIGGKSQKKIDSLLCFEITKDRSINL